MVGFGIGEINMGTAKIKIENLSKSIRKLKIVKPISYQLERGKILALCGGNGAGKSTLLRMITGLIQPTTGTVMINGFDQKEDEQQFLNTFGYMPDNFNFQPSMNGKETINFFAQLRKIEQDRVAKMIDRVGLTEHLTKRMATFSKGMQQRLLLAQAMLSSPDVLILDEPTNGLDPYWINELGVLLDEARQNDQTIIFSTHDLHIAETIADEVIFLNEGKVMSNGPVEKYKDVGLYKTFQNMFFKKYS